MYRVQFKNIDGNWVESSLNPRGGFIDFGVAMSAAKTHALVYPQFEYRVEDDATGKATLAHDEHKTSSVATQEHYAKLSPEPITVIEGWGLSYVRGNAIKYLARAGKKDQTTEGTIKDLEKAISYIHREISTLRGNPSWK